MLFRFKLCSTSSSATSVAVVKMLPEHHDLHTLRSRIQEIHTAIVNFEPMTTKPPILDSSVDSGADSNEDCQWLQPENVPGLRTLRDAVKKDLDVLEKVLSLCFVTVEFVIHADFLSLVVPC